MKNNTLICRNCGADNEVSTKVAAQVLRGKPSSARAEASRKNGAMRWNKKEVK